MTELYDYLKNKKKELKIKISALEQELLSLNKDMQMVDAGIKAFDKDTTKSKKVEILCSYGCNGCDICRRGPEYR